MAEQLDSRRTQGNDGISKALAFAIGAIAGLVMAVLMVALRFAFDTTSFPEVMADWLTRLLPPTAFDFLLERLQFTAKRLLFALILVGHVALGGGLGVLYARYGARGVRTERQRLERSLLLAAGTWLILVMLLTPIMGAGLLGAQLPQGPWGYVAALLLSVGAYFLTLSQLHQVALTRGHMQYAQGRREFIRRAAIISVLVVGGGFAVRTVMNVLSQLTPTTHGAGRGQMPLEVTPNDQFYVVAKSFFTPQVDADSWRLEVGGLVGTPLSLTYQELLSMPAVEEYVTLTCISNTIGGDLISNALWKGVPLKMVLERAGLPSDAERIAFHAADGYFDSFPAAYALRGDVLVAYEMNGEPLPPEHGFPARIIVPGLYGMENVKWLTKIEAVEARFRGYWQQRGWADTAVIKTMSRIDVPESGARLFADEAVLGGVAFAGERGIQKVEVSLDDGRGWEEATEVSQPLSSYTWVLWTKRLAAPEQGKHDVLVRATDGMGTLQTAQFQGSLPSGATGYHRIGFRVQEPKPAEVS